jgi:APA family basic amino acid/polyamine antiporter
MRLKRNGTITTKVIGYPVTSVIIILFSLALIINTVIVQTKQSIIGLVLVLSGVPVYCYFKNKNIRIQNSEDGSQNRDDNDNIFTSQIF